MTIRKAVGASLSAKARRALRIPPCTRFEEDDPSEEGALRKRPMRTSVLLLSLLILTGTARAESAPTPVILPSQVTLTGPKASQRLIVEAQRGERFVGEVSAKAAFASSNPQVGRVDKSGVVWPVGDGVATVTDNVEGETAKAEVRVTGTRAPFVWSFRNHVLPMMTKEGCNSGACHGAAAGKGGLKLTLRGF